MSSVFLKACRREPTPYTPVWLMRQAGRYMKEYRALRDRVPFLALCKDADLVTRVTVEARAKIRADAAIIFSDILLPVEPMGFKLRYLKGNGPSIEGPVRLASDVTKIRAVEPSVSLSFLSRAIRQTKKALPENIPLIGFAGAPFTLCSYLVEGGASKNFSKTRGLMKNKTLWAALMKKVTEVTVSHLKMQVEAGADALQLFDSWVGCLTPAEYKKYVMPYSRQVIQAATRVPIIHFGARSGHLLKLMREAGGDVIGVSHDVTLGKAWKQIGYDRAVQGNLDPRVLCGALPNIRKHVKRILKEAAGRPGHIFNLGHGVLPETPVENVIALVEMVHEMTGR